MIMNTLKKNPLKKVSPKKVFSSFKSEFSRLKLKTFKQKIPLYLEHKDFIIKTAENYDELMTVLQLRYDVFHNELNNLSANRHLIDWDEFDLLADHILVKEKESGKALATYRFICSSFSDRYYSEREFHLNGLLDNDKIKLEIGRACVDLSKRKTNAIYLIWKGLAEYMHKTQCQYVFGCTSVNLTDYASAQALFDHLKDNDYFDDRFHVSPKKEFQFFPEEMLDSHCPLNEDEIPQLVPHLLKSYLSAGSMVCSTPAIDRDFGSVDLFTVLDTDKIAPKYLKKYFSHLNN